MSGSKQGYFWGKVGPWDPGRFSENNAGVQTRIFLWKCGALGPRQIFQKIIPGSKLFFLRKCGALGPWQIF